MQAEWEELARRNWLEESEAQKPAPPTASPVEKVTLLSVVRGAPEVFIKHLRLIVVLKDKTPVHSCAIRELLTCCFPTMPQ